MSWRRVLSAIVALACCIGAPSPVAGQGYLQLASAERGPQFFLAGSPPGTKADVSSVAALRRRVTLDLSDVTVDQALRAITDQAELEMTYSKTVVPVGRRVSLHAREITVAAALVEVLFDAGVDVSLTRTGQMALVKRSVPQIGALVAADSGTISGRVTAKATGSPITGATLMLDQRRQSTTTDADGRFSFANVPAGSCTVRVRYIGYAPMVASVLVRDGAAVTVDFSLERAVQQLEELVTVTPGGMQVQLKAVPSPVSVITAADIEAQRPQTINDVFRQAVPTAIAFHVPTQPIQTAFSVRGIASLAGGSPMKIFIDGTEVAVRSITPIDPASVERIEVIRGPQAATVFGPDAAGGVVQIFTKSGDSSLVHPQIDLKTEVGVLQTPYDGFGSVLRQQYTGAVRGGGQNVSYNIGGGYTRLGDWLPGGATSRQTSPSAYGAMRYGRGVVTLQLHARYLRNRLPSGNNPDLLTAGFAPLSRQPFSVQDWVNETYGLRIAVAPREWWRNSLTVGFDRNTLDAVQTQRRLTTPADTLFTLNSNDERKVSLFYNTAVAGRLSRDVGGSLTAGIDYYRSDARSSATFQALNTEGTIRTSPPGAFSASRATVTNTGYFAQAEVNWREGIFLTAGVRAEDNSNFGSDLGTPVLPRVGVSVVHQIGVATVKIRGAYGRAIRAPAPGLAFGLVSPTSITLASPLLAPERQRGWDAGMDIVFGRRAALSVSGYDQIADDLIVLLQVATTPLPTFQNQNLGRVTNRGFEVEGSLNIGWVQLRGQYGYVRSRVEDLGVAAAPGAQVQVGDRPLRIPTHTAGASLAATPWEGTTLTGGVTYVGSFRQADGVAQVRCFGGTGPCQPTPRDYVIDFPGFAKVNLVFTQRITRQLDGSLSIDNLTNNRAFEGFNTLPVMGRMTMVGLHFRY